MESQAESSSCQRRRVVLLPMPFQGHINPMLQLANILYSKGFSVTILHTHFNCPNVSNYPHFTFKAFLDNDPKDNKLAKLSSQGVSDLLSGMMLLNQYGADLFYDELSRMLVASKREKEPIACLITDALWYVTQPVADSLKLPRIVLRTSSLFCLLVYASIPLLDDQGYFNQTSSVLDDSRTHGDLIKALSPKEESNFKKIEGLMDLEEEVVEFPLLKVKDLSRTRIKGQTDPTAVLITNMVKQTKASSGIIWNTCKELEESEFQKIFQEFPVPNFLIGPFHKYFPASLSSLLEQDRSFIPWLHRQATNSVLYVSFGSATQVDEKDFLEIAHGLANSKQSFLWVVRPGFVKGSEWIERLPDGFLDIVGERGHIVKWAPLLRISPPTLLESSRFLLDKNHHRLF